MTEAAEGAVSYLEIGAGDAAQLRAFFSGLFGWPSHDDAWLQAPGLRAGTHGDDPAPQIYVYFKAHDLQAAAQRVRELGGEAGEVTDAADFGRFVNCRTPGGINFGLHQPAGATP
jgi:predicted enzyme related to lactoylglutathione lyase